MTDLFQRSSSTGQPRSQILSLPPEGLPFHDPDIFNHPTMSSKYDHSIQHLNVKQPYGGEEYVQRAPGPQSSHAVFHTGLPFSQLSPDSQVKSIKHWTRTRTNEAINMLCATERVDFITWPVGIGSYPDPFAGINVKEHSATWHFERESPILGISKCCGRLGIVGNKECFGCDWDASDDDLKIKYEQNDQYHIPILKTKEGRELYINPVWLECVYKERRRVQKVNRWQFERNQRDQRNVRSEAPSPIPDDKQPRYGEGAMENNLNYVKVEGGCHPWIGSNDHGPTYEFDDWDEDYFNALGFDGQWIVSLIKRGETISTEDVRGQMIPPQLPRKWGMAFAPEGAVPIEGPPRGFWGHKLPPLQQQSTSYVRVRRYELTSSGFVDVDTDFVRPQQQQQQQQQQSDRKPPPAQAHQQQSEPPADFWKLMRQDPSTVCNIDVSQDESMLTATPSREQQTSQENIQPSQHSESQRRSLLILDEQSLSQSASLSQQPPVFAQPSQTQSQSQASSPSQEATPMHLAQSGYYSGEENLFND